MIKKFLWAAIPLSASLLFSCSESIEQPSSQENLPVKEEAASTILKSANIYVEEGFAKMLDESLSGGSLVTKSDDFNSTISDMGVKTIERLFPDTGRFEERRRAHGLNRWYRITYRNDVPTTKAGEAISSIDGIQTFEPDRKIKLYDELPFDDPYLPKQWHYYNKGTETSTKVGVDINVLSVWKDYTTGNPDVIVAVVDGGIDTAHEDLAGTVSASSKNFTDGSNNITAHSHGTHVGGTIGAINNNGIGVSGIAGGDAKAGQKGVTLMSCQIFSNDGKGGDGAQALVWAADHGAVIANNSWGYDFENEDGSKDSEAAQELHKLFSQPNEGEYKHSLKDAIDYFNECAGLDEDGNQEGPMAGGVVFFSAGNDDWIYGPPANYSGAISVGAYGPSGDRAYYSCYGTKDDDWVDIAAPGGDYRYSQIVSTLPGNAYGNMQGTSMACPHVSGVAALIVSALGGPGFTRDMLVRKLLNAPNPNINLGNSRIGIPIDAMGALAYGADPEIPAEVTDLSASTSSNVVTASWKVTASENGIAAYAYRLFYGTDKAAVEKATVKEPGGVSSVAVETGMAEVGETLSTSVKVDFESTYYLKVIGYDYGLNYSGNSNIATVTTPANQAPVITPLSSVDNLRVKSFETALVNFSIKDPDGHQVSISYAKGSDADAFQALASGDYQLRIVGSAANPGAFSGTITATDSYGKSSSYKVSYTILENQPPVVVKEMENILLTEIGEIRSINLSEYISDPDGETLTFTTSNTNESAVHATVSSGKMNLTAINYGLCDISVTGADARKKTASTSFKILVREPGIEMQAYPTTVTTSLHIATGEDPESAEIKIASQTGAVFYEETFTCSAFEPAEIDMSNAAPGKYTVSVTFGGKEHKQTIVKK